MVDEDDDDHQNSIFNETFTPESRQEFQLKCRLLFDSLSDGIPLN